MAEIIEYENWKAKGIKLFGDDINTWLFECPICKTAQSLNDFIAIGLTEEEAERKMAFSCIGRLTKEKGCDWSLGGLFTIHKTEVKLPGDGGLRPVFEFYEKQVEVSNV